MALKRLSGLFKRKNKQKEQEQIEAQEERKAIIGEMNDSFQNMGTTMEQVQGHIEQNTESLNRLPELLQEQQELCRMVTIAQEANQGLLSKVQEYFEQRDQAQQTLVEHVAAINHQMREDAQANQQHIAQLVNSYKSGRRMLIITIIFMAFIGTCLLTLLLIVALRPDILGIHSQAQTQQTQAIDPLIKEALLSEDPNIRERAQAALKNM